MSLARILRRSLAAVSLVLSASMPALAADMPVRLAVIRTGGLETPEALAFSGGRWGTKVAIVYSAFVVEHGGDRLLFDTGLGRRIESQYAADMPRWNRPFFGYGAQVTPARDQLDRAGVPPVTRVLLSHAHWDHASGIVDFPEAEVALPAEELALVHAPASRLGGAWPSQVGDASIRWTTLALSDAPYEGFARSADLFGDGTVVAVAMPGHTAGSLGLFVRVSSGRRYFLVGDTVWNAGALAEARPKMAAARWLVDADADEVGGEIARIREVQKRDPSLVVVPAHDGAVQAAMGWFPNWVD